jgi:UDP-3-O-[3-hydroxymyristoyl] glucosamine N-acyltransferase
MEQKKMTTLKKLADITSCKLKIAFDVEIYGVNTLKEASNNEASFLANPKYVDILCKSKAGLICIDTKTKFLENQNYLISEDPSKAFQKIANYFLNKKQSTGFEGVHKSAVIHESAKIAKNVTILPNTVIDANVFIDENSYIGANVYIGANTKIGKNCRIHSNVSIREDCIVHNRVILQNSCVIGSCGFGYIPNKKGEYEKLMQLGNVIIEDDVEIGANTCIDRARFKSTIIKKGTKIDNLVQIAHNVEIGDNSAIAAQSGIAGSTIVGKNVVMGGQVGITGHVKIDDQTMLATRSGVSKNLRKGKYRGAPAIDIKEYGLQYITYKNLHKILTKLQVQIQSLEEKLKK